MSVALLAEGQTRAGFLFGDSILPLLLLIGIAIRPKVCTAWTINAVVTVNKPCRTAKEN